jgi:hypothetical protein
MSPMKIGRAASPFAALVAVTLALAIVVGPASAQKADIEAEARVALSKLFDALTTGNPEKVRPFLAPEFQLVRANGATYDKTQYLAGGIPKISSKPVFDDLVVTRNGDIVVTRMRLKIQEDLQGHTAKSGSPQLIVFRAAPDGWQVVASANFAKLEN